jgi:hypothetical protein
MEQQLELNWWLSEKKAEWRKNKPMKELWLGVLWIGRWTTSWEATLACITNCIIASNYHCISSIASHWILQFVHDRSGTWLGLEQSSSITPIMPRPTSFIWSQSFLFFVKFTSLGASEPLAYLSWATNASSYKVTRDATFNIVCKAWIISHHQAQLGPPSPSTVERTNGVYPNALDPYKSRCSRCTNSMHHCRADLSRS